MVAALLAAACQQSPAPTPIVAVPPVAVAPPSSPLIVNLDRPGGGRQAHLGYPVDLSVAALGMTGIAALELWVGGERVEATRPADPARPAASARWEWIPPTSGDVVLVARAYNSAGRSSQSAPLRLTVVPDPPVQYTLTNVVAAGGETLEALVAAQGGDPSVAAYWNASLADGPLAAGVTVTVPVRDPVPPKPAAGQDATLATMRGHLADNVAPIVPAGLETPELKVVVHGCTVSGQATGGTDSTRGFAFSVLPPSLMGFVALPPVPPSEGAGTTSFRSLGGTNYLMVSAYSTEASAPSAIVPVSVPSDCGAEGWTGDLRLDAGRLVGSAPVDRAYLYLRTGSSDWQRVPEADGTFVDSADGALDFSSVLPPLGGLPLQLEAWGWAGGQLVGLGTGSYDPPAQPLYLGAGGFATAGSSLAGFGTSLDIQVRKAGGEFDEVLARDGTIDQPGPNSTSAERTFRWSSTLAGVTSLQWQILPYPLKDSTTPTPPFLVDTGTIDVHGLETGTFSIDFKPYLTGEPSGVSSAIAWGQSQLIAKMVQANPYVPGATSAPGSYQVNPNGIWLPGASPGSAPSAQVGTAVGPGSLDDLSLLLPAITALYVRVIPYVGTVPASTASNTVSFKIVEPDDPLYLDPSPPSSSPSYQGAFTYKATFFAPTGSDPAYYNCVIVTKGGANVPFWGDWSNGTTHCRPKDDGGWSLLDAFEAFADWVGSAWDYISGAYDWVQNKIVDAILVFVPCEQIANQVADNGKDVCRTLAKTGLQAVMISFGIPPEIPSWETTISAAKGDLRQFILENAQELPGVATACDAAEATHAAKGDFPTCDAIIDKAIDEAVSHLAGERSKAAAAGAGVVVPPGITVEPHPRSTPQPPHFEVALTRTAEPLPTDVTCTLTASMTSTLPSWTWSEYSWSNGQATVVTKSGSVTGEPFHGVKQEVASMPPGASQTYELWLTKVDTWFEPDGWNDHYAQQYAEWNSEVNHAFVLLQKGASVVGSLSGNCISPGSSTQTLTGAAYQ